MSLWPTPYLTPREHAVLTLVGQGCADKEVAALLGIRHATVRYYLRNIFDKLDAQSRLSAVRVAERLGLL